MSKVEKQMIFKNSPYPLSLYIVAVSSCVALSACQVTIGMVDTKITPPFCVHLVTYAKASNTDGNDHFGYDLAMGADGGLLVVGAPLEDSSATGINSDQDDNSVEDSGAVYVLQPSEQAWEQIAYLKASNTGAHDQFGAQVALSADGNTLAVGATMEDSSATGVDGDQGDNGVENSGAVYVFQRKGKNWVQQAYLKASNTNADDHFGKTLALSETGNTLAVGTGDHQSDNSGAVYVFQRNDSKWTQQAYVRSFDTGAGDQFGAAVALNASGDILAVGAPGHQGGRGAAYLFQRNGTSWDEIEFLQASNKGAGDAFGASLGLSANGDTLVVGAHSEDSAATDVDGTEEDDNAMDSGAVYVFERCHAGWEQTTYIKASNTDAGDQFGSVVALNANGDTLAVAAPMEESAANGVDEDQADNSKRGSGAVYVLQRGDAPWAQQSYLKAFNTDADDEFGRSLALSTGGETVAVGSYFEDSKAKGINGDQGDNSAGDSGAVYLFH